MPSSSPLFILYGSATGNAEHIAKDLAATYETQLHQNKESLWASVVCCELDQFKRKCQGIWDQEPQGALKHGVIIITSTTGNGDAPENAGRFVRFLKRKTTSATTLQHCAFAVLALGDTNYDQFCACGKTVDKFMSVLGAVRAVPLACADEATGLEDIVEPWTASVLQGLTNVCINGVSKRAVVSNGTRAALSVAEEKKSEPVVTEPITLIPTISTVAAATSAGVAIVKALLKQDASEPIRLVNSKLLPALTSNVSSSSSLELVDHSGELVRERGVSNADTMSTTSSGTLHYTLNKPFESEVLKARYLTATPLDAAKLVSGDVTKAKEVFNRMFPLVTSDSTIIGKNGKRVIELTLRLPDDYTLEYAPGDSLGLMVDNTPEAVEFVLTMLASNHGLSKKQKVSIDGREPMSVEDIVRSKIDVCSPIKNKRLLSLLAQYATDLDESRALQLLASKDAQGQQLFIDYVDMQRLNVVDILQQFPSCQRITLDSLVDILPCISPRYYSVSSSPKDHQRLSLAIAFSVVDYITPSLMVGDEEKGKRRIRGVATSYMEAISSKLLCGATDSTQPMLRIFPKPTAEFRMPEKLATPLVLIGPGTGIAPFMGFLAHRKALMTSSKEAAQTVVEGTWRGGFELEENEVPISQHDASGFNVGGDFRSLEGVGSVDLFFGCRHKDHDWLYKEEMKTLKEGGFITKLYTAFSRDGNRQYVQDIMKSESERLLDLILNRKACVYVCGDGNAMAKDVQNTIVELLASKLPGGIDEATIFLETMKVGKRFLMDIWS
jgi:sulfite reductase alpha subunit-like flavoprotein